MLTDKQIEDLFKFERNDEDDTYTILKYRDNEDIKDLVIPSAYKEKPITKIAQFAFQNCSLKSVEMTDNIKILGWSAFEGSKELEVVKMSNNITYIDTGTFLGCSRLELVSISESAEEIRDYAFAHCASLESQYIPDSVTDFGRGVFKGDVSLRRITGMKNVIRIGKYAFKGCNNLKNICVADNCKIAEGSLPQNCVVYYFESSVSEKPKPTNNDKAIEKLFDLNYCAFDDTYAITKFKDDTIKHLVMPKEYRGTPITIITSNAFENRKNLQSVDIPNTYTDVEAFAFRGCNNLMEVNGMLKVKTIGTKAFCDCAFKNIIVGVDCDCNFNSFPKDAIVVVSPYDAYHELAEKYERKNKKLRKKRVER